MTSEVGRSAMRKALWHTLPLIGLAYLCAYTDRVNVSFAAAQMNADLRFSATIYGLGGGLFFLGYALFEVPSNLLCVRLHKRPLISQDENGGIHVALFGRDKDEKDRALGVLKALHAREIHYWGSWNVEDVPSS